MKKIIMFSLVTLMVLFTLGGCMLTKKEKAKVEDVKELLVDIVDSFGEAQYTDDDWDSADDTTYYGKMNVLLINDDYLIGKLLLEDNVFLMFEIYFDEYADISRNESAIWCIEITYANFEDREFFYLNYYVYNSLFRPNYDNEIIDYSFNDFVEVLNLFKPADWLEVVEIILEG